MPQRRRRAAALQEAGIQQGAQAAGQHVGRNLQALLEFVKAREPEQGVANNQDTPPRADALKTASNGQAILPKLLRRILELYTSNYHDASDDELEPTFRQVPIIRQHIPLHPPPAGLQIWDDPCSFKDPSYRIETGTSVALVWSPWQASFAEPGMTERKGEGQCQRNWKERLHSLLVATAVLALRP